MVVISLTPQERDAALTKYLTVTVFGRRLTLCRSLTSLPLTSYHGADDDVTIVLGVNHVVGLRDDGECEVTVGFSKVRFDVTDGR